MNIPCIWHLSAEEIIASAWMRYTDFEWKKILDVGCWVSELLSKIWANSQPQRLVWIDPIFKNSASMELGIKQTKSFVLKLMQLPYISDYARTQLSSHKQEIDNFWLNNQGIEYYSNILLAWQWKFDYVFVSFVFRHLPDILKARLAEEILFMKAQGGVIYIADGLPVLNRVQGMVRRGKPKYYDRPVSTMKIS